jgi:HlyD family secretion protein
MDSLFRLWTVTVGWRCISDCKRVAKSGLALALQLDAMDISRPDIKKKKMRRQWILAGCGVVALALVAFFVMRLKPAAPEVDRATVWTDSVKQGPLLVQVRGPGTLVAREDKIRIIPAETDATILRIRVLPGTQVKADTIIMDMVDPTVDQQMMDATLALKGAKADLENTRATVNSNLMVLRAESATLEDDTRQAVLQAKTDKSLYDLGVVSGLTSSASTGKADEMGKRQLIEGEKLEMNQKAIATQIGVQEAKVQQAEAVLALKQRQKDALTVRAGIDGVLEAPDVPLQVGQHVAPGTMLAKVVQPDQLKAALKIAETQARDIQIGQPAEIDTHNGVIDGKVMRIDLAVVNGTVTVDVELAGPLPLGARPDLSVDGQIDLTRMTDVLSVGRPAFGNENSTITLFKLGPDGKTAVRVPVKVGRASVNSIQVLEGLQVGDTVILSDMSRWDGTDRIRLN